MMALQAHSEMICLIPFRLLVVRVYVVSERTHAETDKTNRFLGMYVRLLGVHVGGCGFQDPRASQELDSGPVKLWP